MTPLHSLKAGQKGRILSIEGPPRAVRRIAEFGLRPGVEVEVLRSGPVSIIRANGSLLCLRGSNRLRILIETDGVPSAAPGPQELAVTSSSDNLHRVCASKPDVACPLEDFPPCRGPVARRSRWWWSKLLSPLLGEAEGKKS